MNRGTSRRDYLKLMATAGLATAARLAFAQEDAAKKAAPQAGPPPGHERRIQWWQEAKFGMFIHWGLYSVIGRHEWAMEVEGVPIPQYEILAKHFNPKPNAARDWARLAKQAGQKYMLMTTKHHEGFCQFDTKLTDYCAPKQAAGCDLVREFVDAARAEGLRVGFYYSLMDWHHPDGARCATDEAARQRFVAYTHGLIRELMTNYGKIDVLWYDVDWPLTAEQWESQKMNDMVFHFLRFPLFGGERPVHVVPEHVNLPVVGHQFTNQPMRVSDKPLPSRFISGTACAVGMVPIHQRIVEAHAQTFRPRGVYEFTHQVASRSLFGSTVVGELGIELAEA